MRYAALVGVAVAAVTLGVAGAQAAAERPPTPAKATALDSDPHLAAWWKFDELSGKTAADSSGHKHAGTLEGGLSFAAASVPGRAGKALKFSGNQGCVRIPGFKGITGTRPRTVAAWIKTANAAGEIVAWGQADHGKMWIFAFIRGGLGVTPHGGYLYMRPGASDGAWHHVAVVVREGSLPNLHDDVKLYKDGEPAEIDDIGLLDLWPIETAAKMDVRIGWQFQGLIGDLRLYDRALSDEEIKALSRQAGK